MTSPATHVYRRRVEFADTDAAGVAHFSRLLVMVEEALHDFFRQRGIPILSSDSAWPFVSIQADYLAKCAFGDVITLQLTIEKVGNASLEYSFLATVGPTQLFRGRATLCHVSPTANKASPLPHVLRAILQPT